MTYSINITTDKVDVAATTTQVVYQVTPPDYFTTTVSVSTVQVSATSTNTTFDINFDAVYLRLENLNEFFKGVWVSGTGYIRGDIVTYQNSIYILKNFDVDVTAVYTSTTAPNLDPTYWTQFYWHEAPMANLTVTSTATLYDAIIQNSMTVGAGTFSGSARFNGTATFANTATFLGTINHSGLFTNTNRTELSATTVYGLFNARGESEFFDNVYFKDNAQAEQDFGITGSLNVTGQAAFNTSTNIYGTLGVVGTATFSNNVSIPNSGLTVKNMTVTNNLMVGGLLYPNYKGNYGQVLFTNGATTASWVNLGDLQSWSLNENLYTNGYNIASGNTSTQLKIGSGVPTNLVHSYLEFPDGSQAKLHSNDVYIERSDLNYLRMWRDSNHEYFTFYSRYDPIFEVGNATWPFTSRFYGDLSVSEDLTVNGILSGGGQGFVEVGTGGIKFSDGTIMTSTFSTSLVAATTSTLGGVIVGEYLTIGPGDGSPSGTLNVNTTSLRNAIGSGSGIVPIATTSTLGIIKVGTHLSIAGDGTLNGAYAQATTSSSGIVRIGDGIAVNAGIISVDTSTITVGKFDATEDLIIHDYKIKHSTSAQPYIQFRSALDLNDTNDAVKLSTTYGRLEIHPYRTEIQHANTVTIIASANSGTIRLQSTATIIGAVAGNSVLRVTNIYNHAGTSAPFFPAGVQYQDNTIQYTAYSPDQGLII